MKKIIRTTTFLVFATIASGLKAQLPFLNASICPSASIGIVAVNSLTLSNPSYSLNPGGITSSTPVFTVSPLTPTTYTLYTTGTNTNGATITTNNTVSIDFLGAPTFSLVSNTGNLLGCGSQSATVINIINQNTNPFPGGALVFAFFAPGSSTVPSNASFGYALDYTVTVPGSWSVAVQDVNNSCIAWSTFSILQNTVAPSLAVSALTQTLSCNLATLTLVGSSPSNANGTVSYKWDYQVGAGPVLVSNPTLAVNLDTVVAMSATVNGTYTLTVTDIVNSCTSSSVVTIYKNVNPPIAQINGVPSPANPCSALQVLSSGGVNTSTAFPGPLGTSAILWEGPAPQAPVTFTSNYIAQVSGIYSLTVMDQNNGCTATTTVDVVLGPSAAFVHTLTGGQAVFNGISTNTTSNTTYYWDFGDGNTSLSQNPTHTYLNGGSHLVKFKVTNPGVLCADSVIQSVNVSGVPCSANSGFSMVPTATAQVWDVIPNYPWNISAASWDWGDGSFSNTLYTSHQYAAAGMYNICLSVTVSCVASSSSCASYNVYRGEQQNMIIQVNVVSPDLISGLPPSIVNKELSLNIVPNPNAGIFNLVINANTGVVHMVISDLTGRVLQNQLLESESGVISVDTGDLPEGMYIVTLQSGELKITKRMAINR